MILPYFARFGCKISIFISNNTVFYRKILNLPLNFRNFGTKKAD